MNKFFSDNKSTGLVLFCCAAVSFLLSNSPVNTGYIAFWNYNFCSIKMLPHSMLHIINDALMSVFFFFAALEIKRELTNGELRTIRKSVMPLIAAIGGMLFPALIYLIFCHNKANFTGWGIPMATDIAFSLAVLSLLGNRIKPALRIFITAIAIIDDIGGIITIAVFYPGHPDLIFILMAAVAALLLVLVNYSGILKLYIYLPLGLLLWFLTYNSGINPTIAGVILAFSIPATLSQLIISRLHIVVNFAILPLFAIANLALQIPGTFTALINSPVHNGIFFGLVLGKPLGIFLFAFIASRLNIAALPGKITFSQLAGLGMIAGIGFTVSLFITSIAFPGSGHELYARMAVINASVFSGIAGYCVLRVASKQLKAKDPE